MKILKSTLLSLALLATLFVASQSFALLRHSLTFLPPTLLLLVFLNRVVLALRSKRDLNRWALAVWISVTIAAVCYLVLVTLALPDIPYPWMSILEGKLFSLIFTSCAVAMFILLCLRSETGFPRWTQLLSASVLASLYLLYSPLSYRIVQYPPQAYSHSFTVDFFPLYMVSYNATLDFKENYTANIEERYEVIPSSIFSAVNLTGIDRAWSAREEGFALTSFERFKIPGQLDWKQEPAQGLLIASRRTLQARKEGIGLLRAKLHMAPWNLMMRDNDGRVDLDSVSRVRGELQLRMPKNSFLASSPSGDFVDLPDRDELIIRFDGRQPDITVYYLDTLRFSIVRSVLSSSSDSDLFVKIMAYLLWPIIFMVYGTFQSELAQKIIEKLKRKPKPRPAGFQ